MHRTGRNFARGLGGAAAVVMFATLAGCAGDNRENLGEDPARAGARLPAAVIEPAGDRSPFGNYLVGLLAERQHDYGRAAEAFGHALQDSPDDMALTQRAFYAALQAGRYDAALRHADRLEAAGLDTPIARLLQVAGSMRTADYPAALRRLEAMDRSSDLARLSVPLALGWARLGAGETARALAALAPLDEISGFRLLRLLHEGFINELAGRPAAAEAAYREAMDGPPADAPLRAVRALGGFLERQDRTAEARALYQAHGGFAPGEPLADDTAARLAEGRKPEPLVGSPAEGLAESFFDIASALPRDRAGEVVLIYARLALYLKPDFPLAQLLLGEVLDGFGRYEEAAEIYRKIDSQDPLAWIAQLRLADNIYDLGDTEGAIALLRRMADSRPERTDALIRLGNILRYKERFKEAAATYDEAVARIGTVDRDHWSLLYSRGIALERSGRWEQAEADFLHALELEPEQPFVLNYLGYSWVEKGINLDRARSMLERAVAKRPDDGYIVDSMGWALYKLGEHEKAAAYLERAVALQPQDPVINDHLGDAYWRVGRTKEARIQWSRVLGMDPEPKLLDEIRRKLEKGLQPPDAGG